MEIVPLHQSFDKNLTYLWPPLEIDDIESLSDNEISSVFLFECNNKIILICSDIEKTAQNYIINNYPDLRADIVLAPHHGSRTTITAGFLEHLKPTIVICSAGKRALNSNNLVHTPTTSNFYYTPRDGAITVTINKDGNIKTIPYINNENLSSHRTK